MIVEQRSSSHVTTQDQRKLTMHTYKHVPNLL